MPHPCALDETLAGCAELAAQHAVSAVEASTLSLKEALITNAPALTERLNAAMMKVGAWVEASETFAVEQAPFLVQEIIWWGVADYAYWVVLGAILMCTLPLSLFYLRRSEGLKRYDAKLGAALNEDGGVGDFGFALIGVIILPIVGFIFILANVMAMLKPIVAPRLYLIEYFKGLVD